MDIPSGYHHIYESPALFGNVSVEECDLCPLGVLDVGMMPVPYLMPLLHRHSQCIATESETKIQIRKLVLTCALRQKKLF